MLERVGGRLTSSPADITLGLRTEGDCRTPAGAGDLEASTADWAREPSASGDGCIDTLLLLLGWLGGRESTASTLEAMLGGFSMITHEEVLSAVLGLESSLGECNACG